MFTSQKTAWVGRRQRKMLENLREVTSEFQRVILFYTQLGGQRDFEL